MNNFDALDQIIQYREICIILGIKIPCRAAVMIGIRSSTKSVFSTNLYFVKNTFGTLTWFLLPAGFHFISRAELNWLIVLTMYA
jgi:hypothetical protein